AENGKTCRWTARPSHGKEFEGTTMAAGADLPHDLAQFTVESFLRSPTGFWGLVANGAYFKSIPGRRPTWPGRMLANAHRAELAAAENVATQHIFDWKGGVATPLEAALDEMLVRWKTLGAGEPLVLSWESPRLTRPARSRVATCGFGSPERIPG